MTETEARFREMWHRLDQDKRRTIYAQLDLFGLEGELTLCVRLQGGDWLEMALDSEAATTGIRWVVYHTADYSGHSQLAIYPPRLPALWRTAEHYLGRAMYVLEAQRRRTA
jgi:hypothetical protein